MSTRTFPVLLSWEVREDLLGAGMPRYVPWSFVEPHRQRAMKNHNQTLERLAERGGLSPYELLFRKRKEGFLPRG